MSLLTVEEARAAGIGGALGDDALQDAIDEEEAWLARRIGPLVGERTEHFGLAYLRPPNNELRLRRPTDTVVVTEDGTTVSDLFDIRANGWRIGWTVASGLHVVYSLGAVDVTYEPNDELEVRRALKSLLALTTTSQPSGGVQSEIMGSYSYTRAAGTTTRLRASVLRELRAPAEADSSRLRSSVGHGLAGSIGR